MPHAEALIAAAGLAAVALDDVVAAASAYEQAVSFLAALFAVYPSDDSDFGLPAGHSLRAENAYPDASAGVAANESSAVADDYTVY